MTLTGAVLVTRGSTIVYEAYTHTAGPGTRFQIASLSKQFTAAAALLLAGDGLLSLSDPMAHRLPGSPEAWAGITAHHLLTHTSGLPHWDAATGSGPRVPLSRADTAARVMRLLPLTAPGRRWHYSSPGYVLAALLIEYVTGHPYQGILRDRVLDPLSLHHTGTGDGTGSGATDPSCLPGAGDLWSTARDLARWARALEQGRLLGPGPLHLMFTAHAVPEPHGHTPLTATGYGYGVFLGTLSGHPARFHHGDNPGHRSLLVRLPHLDTGIVILSRGNDTDPYTTLTTLLTTPALRPLHSRHPPKTRPPGDG
ncbi:serine hydrolase domain-containing protein [Streptomyces sp. NPDC001889]